LVALAQGKQECYPIEIDSIADRIAKNTSEVRKVIIRNAKDFHNSISIDYTFNYSDIEAIVKRAEKQGCRPFPLGVAMGAMEEYAFNKIRNTDMCFETILRAHIKVACTYSTDESMDGVYIPRNIKECMSQLDKDWSPELKDKFRKDSIDESLEVDIWRSIRNSWGLCCHSRLAKYFNDNGISSAELAGQIVLACYKRHLLGLPLDSDREIRKARKRWDQTREPLLSEYPKEARNISNISGTFPENGGIYFFTSTHTVYWVYNYRYGWRMITKEVYEKFEVDDDPEEWLKTIFKN
jgi:hypothetical protein